MKQPEIRHLLTRRLLRWAFLVLLVVVLAAWAVTALWLTPERFRDQLAGALAAGVDRPVRLEGGLAWTFWPRPGLRAESVHLRDGGGGGRDLARSGPVVVRVQWLPLLVGDLVPASVTLHDLRVHLRRGEDGKPNWAAPPSAPARARPVATAAAAATGAEDRPPDPGPDAGAFSGHSPLSLRVMGGRVIYADGARGWEAQLSGLEVQARVRHHRRAWLAEDLDLAGRVEQAGIPGKALPLRLEGDLAADPQGVRLAGGRMEGAGLRMAGSAALGDGQGRWDVDWEVTEVEILEERLSPLAPAGLDMGALAGGKGRVRGHWPAGGGEAVLRVARLRAGGFAARYRGRLGWRSRGVEAHGHMEAAVAEPERLRRLLGPHAPPVPPGAWHASRLSGDMTLRPGGPLVLDPVAGEVAGVRWGGRATLASSGAGPVLGGRLRTGTFAPRDLVARLGGSVPRTRDDSALKEARLAADFGVSADSAALTSLSLFLDGSHFQGDLGYRWAEGPVARLGLTGDRLDLDRYRPPEEGDNARSERGGPLSRPVLRLASARPVARDAPLATVIPAWVRRLDVAGRMRLEQLRAGGLALSGVDVAVRGREGRFRAAPLRARVHGGTVEGSLDLDATGGQPRWTLDLGWSGVGLAPLQRGALPRAGLRGTGRGRVSLEAGGWRPHQRPREWTGDGHLAVTEGAVLGLDLAHRLRATLARLQGQESPEAPADPRTPFESLSARYYVDRGRLHVTELAGRSPWLEAEGNGKTDLVDRRLSGRVALTVTAAPPGPANAILDRLKGVTVPLRVRGTLQEPRLGLDLAPLLRSERGAEAARELRRQKERLRQEAEDQLKGLKKRLQDALE